MRTEKNIPKILITIPNRDLKDYCEKLIKTIKCTQPYQLLLIDNESHDGSVEYFQEVAKSKDVFAMINGENSGASGSWNSALVFGFQLQGADKVIILNNDTLLLPHTIDTIINDLDRAGVGIATAKDVSGRVVDEKEFFAMKADQNKELKETPDFSCFGINKLCFEKVGYFDEAFYPAYFEDNDYHYRMKLEGLHALCNYGNYYFHYGSRSKMTSKRFEDYTKMRHVKNGEYYKAKWGGEPDLESYKEPFAGIPPKQISIDTFEDYNGQIDRLNN